MASSSDSTALALEEVVGNEDKPEGCLVEVQNLSYKVRVRDDGFWKEKLILHNVSTVASPGEILAVVGPSGAGKSTFLDAVAGQIESRSLKGSVFVNGSLARASFKRLSGYVMQDDALFPTLTVRETLMFSARLRLPRSMSMAEKTMRVEAMIAKLGLTGCAETVIGNHEIRGVSGGEKRRVSIGVDLIHNPAVLFLDEPTSGLDSSAALKVVQILHSMAEERNRTIIMTVHQPSHRMLSLIHKVLVLAQGSVIFQGQYLDLAVYFEGYGKKVPEHVNMLEYTLDLIQEEQKGEEGLQPLITYAESHQPQYLRPSPAEEGRLSPKVAEKAPNYSNTFLEELAVLIDRNFKTTFRTKALFVARSVLLVVTALTMGSVFWRLDFTLEGIRDRQSYFAFVVALVVFTSTEGLPIFIEERQIFMRETSRGSYRTATYVVAGALVFLPFLFALACVHSGVAYFMVGLRPDVHSFFVYVATIFITFAVANSFVVLVAAAVPDFISANTVITAFNAYFFLFSGFYIAQSRIPKYWIWMHYLSSFKYPLEMLANNELRGQASQCWQLSLGSTRCITLSDATLSMFYVEKINMLQSGAIMTSLFIGYRILFFVALKYQSRLLSLSRM